MAQQRLQRRRNISISNNISLCRHHFDWLNCVLLLFHNILKNETKKALATAVWSVLKAKRRKLLYQDGFISHFYGIMEHLSPVLAWGFLGPESDLKKSCFIFKVKMDWFDFPFIHFLDWIRWFSAVGRVQLVIEFHCRFLYSNTSRDTCRTFSISNAFVTSPSKRWPKMFGRWHDSASTPSLDKCSADDPTFSHNWKNGETLRMLPADSLQTTKITFWFLWFFEGKPKSNVIWYYSEYI